MPRHARIKSETGIYHVVLRGINQVQLFYDELDKHAFLTRLARYKDEGLYQVYAYALMGNHVHLLIKEDEDSVSVSIKKLTVSYCHYFNTRYDRTGYLFAGRFKSMPVESDTYLLAVLRYIHHNPVKIGKPISFWTSYSDYLTASGCTDADFILSMFDDDKAQARKQFEKFLNEEEELSIPEELVILSAETASRLTDEQAIEIISEIAEGRICSKLAGLAKEPRDKLLRHLRGRGLSVRQISRLTGISRGIVQEIK